tara:strand:+ start:561 stop:671 length:111 start_codon:yes stop_codon:yes gene_type:complete
MINPETSSDNNKVKNYYDSGNIKEEGTIINGKPIGH